MNYMENPFLCFGNWLITEDTLLLNEVRGWKPGA